MVRIEDKRNHVDYLNFWCKNQRNITDITCVVVEAQDNWIPIIISYWEISLECCCSECGIDTQGIKTTLGAREALAN